VAKDNGQNIAFEQPASRMSLQGLSSSAVRGNPIERITYAISSEKDDMHVTAEVVLVRKLAAMEQETDLNPGPPCSYAHMRFHSHHGSFQFGRTSTRLPPHFPQLRPALE
jgi:hypothetical protein